MSFEAQFGVHYYYIINIINIIIVELSINLNEQRSFLLHEKKITKSIQYMELIIRFYN